MYIRIGGLLDRSGAARVLPVIPTVPLRPGPCRPAFALFGSAACLIPVVVPLVGNPDSHRSGGKRDQDVHLCHRHRRVTAVLAFIRAGVQRRRARPPRYSAPRGAEPGARSSPSYGGRSPRREASPSATEYSGRGLVGHTAATSF